MHVRRMSCTPAEGHRLPRHMMCGSSGGPCRTVSDSSIEILTGKDDHLLRRLRLSIDLDVPPELRAKTGGKSGLAVKVDMSVRDVNRPVRVRSPAGR